MTTSNLTAAEQDVYNHIRQWGKPSPGMFAKIARHMGVKRQWVSYVLRRLVASGHLRKVSRGIYEVLYDPKFNQNVSLS